MSNLLSGLPTQLSEELITVLAQSPHTRIERIVSAGQASPPGFWYDQEEHEWVVVVRGEAKLRFESGDPIHLRAGDYVLIPPRKKHRVDWTKPDEPTVWLAVFYRA